MSHAYTEDQLVEQTAIGCSRNLVCERTMMVTAALLHQHNATTTKGFQWMRPFHPPVKPVD